MMLALRQSAMTWHTRGVPAVVVEIIRVDGSAPREAGTRMLVSSAAFEGTIGGGHLELEAIATARRALGHAVDLPLERDYPLGPALGQCCGGRVRLRYARLAEESPADWPDDPPLFALQLHGAGHVGRAIVEQLERLPCVVQWVDERTATFDEAFAQRGGRPLPAHIGICCVDSPAAEVSDAAAGTHVLVMTHSHDLDAEICAAALRRDDLGMVGVIGSATKRARFERRWQERGLGPEAIGRLVCPIGIPGIEGKAPAVIAVAVVAQLLMRSGA